MAIATPKFLESTTSTTAAPGTAPTNISTRPKSAEMTPGPGFRVRDLPGLVEVGLPIYARGVTPFGPLHRGPGELNYSISCGGIVINPGDIIVADLCGIAVVRREFARDTVSLLRAHKARMAQYVRDVKAGCFSNDWVDAQLSQDNCLFE